MIRLRHVRVPLILFNLSWIDDNVIDFRAGFLDLVISHILAILHCTYTECFNPKDRGYVVAILREEIIRSYPRVTPRPLALARLTVALPRASPTPLPFTPLVRNMGAFRSISGTIKNRT